MVPATHPPETGFIIADFPAQYKRMIPDLAGKMCKAQMESGRVLLKKGGNGSHPTVSNAFRLQSSPILRTIQIRTRNIRTKGGLSMEKIIRKKVYNTETAELVASRAFSYYGDPAGY